LALAHRKRSLQAAGATQKYSLQTQMPASNPTIKPEAPAALLRSSLHQKEQHAEEN
jgi:hypothetical protein